MTWYNPTTWFPKRPNMSRLAQKALGDAGGLPPSGSITTYDLREATREEAPIIAAEAVMKALDPQTGKFTVAQVITAATAEPFSIAKHHHTISNVLKALETQAALLAKEANDEARLHIANDRTEHERHKKAVNDEHDRHSAVVTENTRKASEVEQLQAYYRADFDKLKPADPPPFDQPLGETVRVKPSDVATTPEYRRKRNRKPTPDVVRNKGEDVKSVARVDKGSTGAIDMG